MLGHEDVEELLVRDAIGVELDPERLGVAVAVANGAIGGILPVAPGVSNAGGQDAVKRSESLLRTPESSEREHRDVGAFPIALH